MNTIENTDFTAAEAERKVAAMTPEGALTMATISIMSVVGSAVPSALRDVGLLVCWYLVRDGEKIGGPILSLPDAEAKARDIAAESFEA